MPKTDIINERLQFLKIDKEVVRNLRIARKLIEPELDRMLEEFYSHVLNTPQVRQAFANDQSVERARQGQKNHWLQTLLGGRFNSSYFDKAETIGRAHARVGLTPNWYIGGYCMMLDQFVRHVSAAAPKAGHDAGPIIDAVCKAVMLDVDLVIHCYLEAKDKSMLSILRRAMTFAEDMDSLNSELSQAVAAVQAATDAMPDGPAAEGGQEDKLATLAGHVEAMTATVGRMNERISRSKTDDRLYVSDDIDHTGTFGRLMALIQRK